MNAPFRVRRFNSYVLNTRSLRQNKLGFRSFSSNIFDIKEAEARFNEFQNIDSANYSKEQVEALAQFRSQLSSKLQDQKVKDAFTQIELNLAEIGRTTIKTEIPPPPFDVYKKLLPEHKELVENLEKQYHEDMNRKLKTEPVPFPPLKKIEAQLEDSLNASNEILNSYQQIAKKQMSKIAQSIKEDQYYLNHLLDISVDKELAKSPELEAAIEKEIVDHHWNEESSSFGVFPSNDLEIERQVLSDVFGSSSPIVTKYKGDLKQALEESRK